MATRAKKKIIFILDDGHRPFKVPNGIRSPPNPLKGGMQGEGREEWSNRREQKDSKWLWKGFVVLVKVYLVAHVGRKDVLQVLRVLFFILSNIDNVAPTGLRIIEWWSYIVQGLHPGLVNVVPSGIRLPTTTPRMVLLHKSCIFDISWSIRDSAHGNL